MRRKKNTEVIVQIVILSGIMLLLAAGLIGGRVNNYVHPRYHFGMWVSIGILFLFIISLITDLNKARHNVNLKPYLLFAVPLIIAVIFPANGIGKAEMVIAKGSTSLSSGAGTETVSNSDTVNNNAVNNNTGNNNNDTGNNNTGNNNTGNNTDTVNNTDTGNNADGADNSDTAQTEEDDIDYTNNPDNLLTSSYDTEDANTPSGNSSDSAAEEVPVYDNMSDKYKGEQVDGATVIKDDNFAVWYYDTYDYLKDFVGKRYQFLAQVYPSNDFGKNRFLAGRYIMVCCAADASGYGIICENDISPDLKENEWITVTGTIQEYEFQGAMVPMLTDTVITKAKAPKDEYVYYNLY